MPHITQIPPTLEVREKLARLHGVVYEALGLAMVMTEAHRQITAEIIAAHLYVSGATLPPRIVAAAVVAVKLA